MSISPLEKLPVPMDIYGHWVMPQSGLYQSLRNAAFLARLTLDSGTGRMERAAKELAQCIDWANWKPGRPTILCLRRATFSKDLSEMQSRTDLNLITLRATLVKRVQEKWIPREWRIQTYFSNFLDNELLAFRPGLERFGKAFLRAVAKIHPIDAVLVANSDYWQDEALRRSCRILGIPFLVLCRENYTIRQDQANVLNHYRKANFRYTGDGIAVYSQLSKEVMQRMNAFPDGAIWVTGAPRFDRWRDVQPLPPERRDCVTLLSYAYPIYEATENFHDVATIFCELADQYRSLRFVLKLKKNNEISDALALCPRLAGSRVECVADWPLFDLLPRSRAIIGCNSLAVAEGLLARAPVVVPAWHDALANPDTCLYHHSVPAHAKCIYFPRSAQEFRILLEQAAAAILLERGTLEERRACFSEHILYSPDASASELVERFIRHYIARPGLVG
jgi:hypothetical protein